MTLAIGPTIVAINLGSGAPVKITVTQPISAEAITTTNTGNKEINDSVIAGGTFPPAI